jgi:GTPase SAR1 family protein
VRLLADVRYWMNSIREHASPHCIKLLLGNKVDIKPKVVSTSRGEAVAEEFGIRFFETSAKSGHNVSTAFHAVARECVLKALVAEGIHVTPEGEAAAASGGKRCTVM